jgi:demethoxyubiquinone hydroxylase (CLK1/Coq7/Cat5 family)
MPKITDPKVLRKLHQMLRVNHAGEVGANAIYAGQAAFIPSSHATQIQHMVSHNLLILSGIKRKYT